MRTARLPTLRVLVASVVVRWVPTPLQVPCRGGGYPPAWMYSLSSPVEYSPPLGILTPSGILITRTKSPQWDTHPPPYRILTPSILTHWDTQPLDIPQILTPSLWGTHPLSILTPWDTHSPPSGWNDWHCWKNFLHATTVAGGKYLGQNHVPNRGQTHCSSSHMRRWMTVRPGPYLKKDTLRTRFALGISYQNLLACKNVW